MPSNFQVISGSKVSENCYLPASTETPVILQTQTHRAQSGATRLIHSYKCIFTPMYI